MNAATVELEGSWEEILARASEWAGRRVRLTILPDNNARVEGEADQPGSFWEPADPSALFDEQGIGPVDDVDSFVASLPRVGDVRDLWGAVAAERAGRRVCARPVEGGAA